MELDRFVKDFAAQFDETVNQYTVTFDPNGV